MPKHPEQFTVEAWSANAIAFIEDQGLTREFSDWCGGWPCPVDPKVVTAAPHLLRELELNIRAWENAIEINIIPERYQHEANVRIGDGLAVIAKARGGYDGGH